MKLSSWQFDRNPWYGWAVSVIIHLLIVIAVSLLLMPAGDGTTEVLQVEVTLDDIGADLVELESSSVELDSLEDDVADDRDAAAIFEQTDALGILSPNEALAAGTSGGTGTGGSSTAGRRGRSGGAGQTSFFGTVATGNSFVYILDVSPSMNARSGQRLVRAVLELLESLDQLSEQQSFYVIVFGWETRRMFDSDQLFPSPIPASGENKRRLRDWLAQAQTIPGTDPRKALEISLALKPSAVFFLSDGEFNKPDRGKFFGDDATEAEDVIIADVGSAIPIHTIAFEDPICEARMHGIATMTNGQHSFVPAPPGSVSTSPASHVSKGFAKTVSGFVFSDESPASSLDATRPGTVDVAMEDRARYQLHLAKMLQGTAKPSMARRYYERVAHDYPDTQAAKEALASLQQLSDSTGK